MKRLAQFYRLLNVLSIDVALGAVCCSASFAIFFDVHLRPYALLSLGLTVWIIYTADHLIDALKIKTEASTQRHRFHQKHFRNLLFVIVVGILLDFILILFVRQEVFNAGLILFGIVLIYLLFNSGLGFMKEIIVALLYSGGVLLPVLSLKTTAYAAQDVFFVSCFFITALINIVLFSWYDYKPDKQDGCTSFSIRFGLLFTQRFLLGLFIIQLVLIGFMFVRYQTVTPAALLLSMNTILFLLFIKPWDFEKQEIFRLAGDAVFLFPSFLLIIGWF